jgi:hypothetical protein
MSEADGDRVQDTVADNSATAKPLPGARARSVATRRFSAFLMLGILVLLIGAVGFTVANHWRDLTGNTAPSRLSTAAADPTREITALRTQIDALEARVAALEKSAMAAQSAGASLGDAAARIGTMDTRLAALESQIARAADRDVLVALQDRLARLEMQNTGEMLRRAAATLALANVARAAESAMPFKAELAALAVVVPNDPALGALRPLADSGVPSLATLRARFPDAARAALDAERVRAAGGNLFARLWVSVTRLVSIRPIGDVQGTTDADRLARAQADLDRGEVPAAVTEVQNLTGAAAMAMASWRKGAEAHLAVDRAVADMDARIAQALAAPAPPAPSGGSDDRAPRP